MRKNDRKMKNKYICASCAHILGEKNQTLPEYVLEQFNFLQTNGKICSICGQKIKNEENQNKDISLLESALKNPKIKVVGFTAPSVRVALGDEFGFEMGANVEGKMVSAIKKLGFFKIFDMNTAADFTVVEEAKEFAKRLEENKNLPVFTSCCPGWVNYCTKLYPSLIPNLSTVKSPQQIFGSLINTYFAKSENLASTDMFVVSIVPCLAKKSELLAENINTSEGFDVDVAITTKELATIIKNHGIDFANLKDEQFDNFFGSASGSGAIFGNTGGVTEAIVRSLNGMLSQKDKKILEYKMVRGLENIKEATISVGDKSISVAVVIGLRNVPKIIEEIKQNPNKYQFVEVMASEGGCIGGAGQPKPENCDKIELLKHRAKSLYESEIKKPVRLSHENAGLKKVYSSFLGEFGGAKAKELLQRTYEK